MSVINDLNRIPSFKEEKESIRETQELGEQKTENRISYSKFPRYQDGYTTGSDYLKGRDYQLKEFFSPKVRESQDELSGLPKCQLSMISPMVRNLSARLRISIVRFPIAVMLICTLVFKGSCN